MEPGHDAWTVGDAACVMYDTGSRRTQSPPDPTWRWGAGVDREHATLVGTSSVPPVKALVKRGPGPGLDLDDVPTPVPGGGEVLIRVMRTGICGTDLHIRSWDPWAADR